jgi:hypothetical protein
MPLLHPARTLDAGNVRATGGVSANFALGSLGTDRNAAAAEVGGLNGAPQNDSTYAKGAIVQAVVAPGLAPFVAARVGVGAQFEAGLTYTGRGARVDLRRSFSWDHVSLSLGAGASYLFYGSEPSGALPYVDLAWAGLRAGWDHAEISALTSEEPAPNSVVELSATRFYGGAVAGFGAGFRHVHVALELDVAYQTLSGSYFNATITVAGVSAAPAAALWIDF